MRGVVLAGRPAKSAVQFFCLAYRPDRAVELASAFKLALPCNSASKLGALQKLRVEVHPQEPSQLANNFDSCRTAGRGSAGMRACES